MGKDKQRGWVSDGRLHDVPTVIRIFGFGPQEGAQWGCKCGALHPLVDSGDERGLVWDTDTDLRAVPEAKRRTGGLITQTGARLIPHHQREVAINIADKITQWRNGGTVEEIEMVLKVLHQLVEWGYVAFPEPVAGEKA